MKIQWLWENNGIWDMRGLTSRLTRGLTSRLTRGLTSGLTRGLTSGLSRGLTSGLTRGLTSGLTRGLTSSLSRGLTSRSVCCLQDQCVDENKQYKVISINNDDDDYYFVFAFALKFPIYERLNNKHFSYIGLFSFLPRRKWKSI
jgi:hypothetical protein